MKTPVLAAAAGFAMLLAGTLASARTYEHARALGTRCSTCHSSSRPHASNLNAAGRYFLTHRTLDGYVPQAQAKRATPTTGRNSASAGIDVYRRSCALCHGDKGQGTALAKAITGPPQHARTEAEIAAVIRDGIEGTTMAAFRDALTAAEIAAVTRYVASLRK